MNSDAAMRVIRQVGVVALCCFDGCLCASFALQGISVDISCHKSVRGQDWLSDFSGVLIRVYSKHIDVRGDDLANVAREVAIQLYEHGYDISVRFCDYKADAKHRCTYCGESRTDIEAYLCETCQATADIARRRDYRCHEFIFEAEPQETSFQ